MMARHTAWIAVGLLAFVPAGCSTRGPLSSAAKPAPGSPVDSAAPAGDGATVPPVTLQPAEDRPAAGRTAPSSPIVLQSSTPPTGGFLQAPIVTNVSRPSEGQLTGGGEVPPRLEVSLNPPAPIDLAAATPVARAVAQDPYATAGMAGIGAAPRSLPEEWSALRESTIRNERKIQERLEGLERRLLGLMQDQRDLEARVESAEKELGAIGDRVDVALGEQVRQIEAGVRGAQETVRDLNQSQRNLVMPKLQTLEGLVSGHSTALEELGTRVDFALSLLQGETVAESNQADGDGDGGRKPKARNAAGGGQRRKGKHKKTGSNDASGGGG